ncbi:uncharacterized protein LOC114854694 isoform X1 [Betta splendens]|uniref:Uncharacterized protein LOC114854694 isoform X1 n=1 Tax=Betta splendens TaxID=158456 RepID=A0A6P7MF02_BETSP|nr:uncharacterized protein LOC114854694 isoform X1 [Betta splendens]
MRSLIYFLALVSSAGALVCQSCSDAQCSNTAPVTCSSETMCLAASAEINEEGNIRQLTYKACASSSLCPATGSQTFSVNLALSKAVLAVGCCDTDNCNSLTPPIPAAQSLNSLSCKYRDPSLPATGVTQCRGIEDRCFQVKGTTGSSVDQASGCASNNLCAAAASLAALPILQSFPYLRNQISCCQSNLCTDLTTTTTTPPPPPKTTTTPPPPPPRTTTRPPSHHHQHHQEPPLHHHQPHQEPPLDHHHHQKKHN